MKFVLYVGFLLAEIFAITGGIDSWDREFHVDPVVSSGIMGSQRDLTTSSKSYPEIQSGINMRTSGPSGGPIVLEVTVRSQWDE